MFDTAFTLITKFHIFLAMSFDKTESKFQKIKELFDFYLFSLENKIGNVSEKIFSLALLWE